MTEKIVRDRLPAIDPHMRVRFCPPDERAEFLRAKLTEEYEEFMASDNDPEELADLLAVIHALGDALGNDVAAIRAAKKHERGEFDLGLIWDDGQ